MKRTLILLSFILSFLTSCTREAASVGLIGGADGPTAIMVSQNVPLLPAVLVVLGIILLIAIVIVFITHKK